MMMMIMIMIPWLTVIPPAIQTSLPQVIQMGSSNIKKNRWNFVQLTIECISPSHIDGEGTPGHTDRDPSSIKNGRNYQDLGKDLSNVNYLCMPLKP